MPRALLLLLLLPGIAPAQNLLLPADLPARESIDVLTRMDGTKVDTAADWKARRAPELKRLFEFYMYGRMPEAAKYEAKTLFEDRNALGGKATLKEVELDFGPPDHPKIYLLIALPNAVKGPAPAFLGLNFGGNHSLLDDAKIRLPTAWMPKKPTDDGRGKQAEAFDIAQTIDRGYAVVTAYYGDIADDSSDGRAGVLWNLRKLVPPEDDDPGCIMAWAWGMGRMLDYIIAREPRIDGKRVGAVGHSRLGKATIVAGVFDERFAAVFPHQAGCGGTAPSRTRNPKNEGVERINKAFPHWFDTYFKSFDPNPDKLPFDQHCLIALCAPRPVLLTNAVEDQWSNPEGQFAMLKGAEPAYKLFGREGCAADKMPAVGTLVDSKLGYWIRPGKHSTTKEDWKVFCDYGDKWLR